MPNTNADVVHTVNSHALEALKEFFKRGFENNGLLAITKIHSSSNWSKSTPTFQ